ncbi:MAG TPA: polyprenyl synthetase family protein, partial [Gammaproteobacteria bacterium]|nr:polyprenyl synthetase family protein [Gammaproteobacteria bacterium]
MSLDQVRDLTAEAMQAVDQLIHERLRSDVLLINQLGQYIVNSGGKRLRPLLVLLAANACGYSGRYHLNLAAIVEFIHTATLL